MFKVIIWETNVFSILIVIVDKQPVKVDWYVVIMMYRRLIRGLKECYLSNFNIKISC